MEEALAPLLEESLRREAAALERLSAAQWAELSQRAVRGEPSLADLPCRLRFLDCALRVGQARAWRTAIDELAASQRSDGSFPRPDGVASDRHATAMVGELLLRASAVLPDAQLAAPARRALARVAAPGGAGSSDDARLARSDAVASIDGQAAVLRFLGVACALVRVGEGGADLERRVETTRCSASNALLAAQLADGSFTSEGAADACTATAHALVGLAGEIERRDAPAAEAGARGLAFLAAEQAATGAFGAGAGVARSLSCVRAAMLAGKLLAQRFPHELDRLGARRDLRFVERGFAWLLAARSERGWGEAPGDDATFERSCEGLALLAEVAAYRAPEPAAVARLWGITA